MSAKEERELCIEFARKFLSKDSTPLQVETLASLLVSVRAAAPAVKDCPHCGVPLTGMNANPDECLHKPAVEQCDCTGTNAPNWHDDDCPIGNTPVERPAVEDAPRCEHGVEAGGHCSVCGTLSDSRTPLRVDITDIQEFDGACQLIVYVEGMQGAPASKAICAALRAATPEGPNIRRLDGYALAGCADRVGVVVRCQGSGILEKTSLELPMATDWDRFADEINNLQTLAGPTIREVCEGRDRTGQP